MTSVTTSTKDMNNPRSRRLRVALVRGHRLTPMNLQLYQPLTSEMDLCAFTTSRHVVDADLSGFRVERLPYRNEVGFPPLRKLRNLFYRLRPRAGYDHCLDGLEDRLSGFDVVTTEDTCWQFSYQAARARQRHGGRLVVMVWENVPFSHEDDPLTRHRKQVVRETADLFIAHTAKARETLLREGVSADRIRVVPNGIDVARFAPQRKTTALLQRFGLREDTFVVLFVGRFLHEKGVYDLLYAAHCLTLEPDAMPHRWQFVFVGSGAEESGLQQTVQRLGLNDLVAFRPPVPHSQIHDLYAVSDVVAAPSRPTPDWEEQFGYVMVEAMACGKPVISTVSGCIPEVVGDAGVLVSPGDWLALAEEVKQLAQQLQRAARLGEQGRARVCVCFDANKNARTLKEVLEDVAPRSS